MEALSVAVDRTIRTQQLLRAGDTVIVGCSGGADSVSLLHYLCQAREQYGLAGIVAAHVHHGLRGVQADEDAAFVRRTAEAWGCRYEEYRADIRTLSGQTGAGLEETGRRERYAFFERLACRYAPAVVATAHTRSDAAETMIFHLCRGTGITGLRGIPVRRGAVIRPLIDCTRAQVEQYLAENGLSHREDGSNADVTFSRNRIRHEVMPVLRSINPSCEQAMARCAGQMQQAEAFFSQQAEALRQQSAVPGEEGSYYCGLLRQSVPIIRSYFWHARLTQAGIEPENRWIDLAEELLAHRGAASLPRGWRMTASTETWRLFRPDEGQAYCLPAGENGVYLCGGWKILLSGEKTSYAGRNVHNLFANLPIDRDKIIGKLFLRTRRAGDRFEPAGRKVRKTLKDLLYEAGIAADQRNQMPLLCDEEGIVFIPEFGREARVLPDEATRAYLYITAEKSDEEVLS